jgi:hypothetical protein
MTFPSLALLYGGPDQLMPLTSGLAAVFAFLLIFWNKVLVALGKLLNLFKAHKTPQVADDTPSQSSGISENSHIRE